MILEILALIAAIMFFFTIVLAGWGIGRYNYFQTATQDIKSMWSNIFTEYQRRYDLFLNLGKTVKSYKNHEHSVMTQIAQARSQLVQPGSVAKKQKIMNKMDSLFAGMKVQFEAYPELKADKSHDKLMEEIRVTEDRINIARTSVNDIIEEYNTNVKTFPSSIIAGMFGFKTAEYYEADKVRAQNNAPEIEI